MAKYNNTRWNTYDSKLESYVANDLELRRLAGEIKEIEKQVRVPFIVNGVTVVSNYVDFRVTTTEDEVWYVEAKGAETPVYRIQKKLHKALLDTIDPGCRYFVVKGNKNSRSWQELNLVRNVNTTDD